MKQVYLKNTPQNFVSKSPWGFLIKVSLSVFLAETLIMLLFLVLPKLPDLVETFLDSTLLSILIAPALYFFIYQPLVREISVRSKIETELRQSQTLLKQQAQELEETLLKLQQAPQLMQAEKMLSLGRLVAGIAHEINNPINFVYGNLVHIKEYNQDLLELLQLYQQYYPEPHQDIRAKVKDLDVEFLQKDFFDILASMSQGCHRIRQIVLSLRNFSRLDESEFKVVNIHEGLESALIILQHRLNPKQNHNGITIRKTYENLPEISCFPGQLNQVFMNILTNAVDALEEASRSASNLIEESRETDNLKQSWEPAITIQTSTIDASWIQISIADNGLGIPEEVRKKIFDPFFTTKPVGQGTGMGLAISYQIVVEKHGGQLLCFSTPGTGTEFLIQMPVNSQAEKYR